MPATRVKVLGGLLDKAAEVPALVAASDKFKLERDFERGERLRLLKLVEQQSFTIMSLQLKNQDQPSYLSMFLWTAVALGVGFGSGYLVKALR